MARIDDAIRAAETEVTTAQALPETTEDEKATKATKVAAAQAKVSVLKDQKTAIENDISDAVRGRLPDAERTAKENERKAVASALGIPVDQLTDEKLAQVKQAYQGQQSEVEREKNRAEAAEQQVTNLTTSEERAKRIAENARKSHEDSIKRGALRAELLTRGVIHETNEGGTSYLDLAVEQAERLGTVEAKVEVQEDGSLKVVEDVKGAGEAADKAAQKFPAFFGDVVENPRQTPRGKTGGGGATPSYDPPLAVRGPRNT